MVHARWRDVGHRVLGEGLDRLADPPPPGLVRARDGLAVLDLAFPHELVAAVEAPVLHRDVLAVLQDLEQRRAWHVDQVDAGLGHQHRTLVAVAGRRRLGDVQDALDSARDEVFAGDAVDGGVVDDGDVGRAEPFHEPLGALAYPHFPGELVTGRRVAGVAVVRRPLCVLTRRVLALGAGCGTGSTGDSHGAALGDAQGGESPPDESQRLALASAWPRRLPPARGPRDSPDEGGWAVCFRGSGLGVETQLLFGMRTPSRSSLLPKGA